MHQGGAILRGGLHVRDGGQFLDVHIDGLGRVACLFQAVGHNGGDGIADMAHFALRQDRVHGLLHRRAVLVGHLPAAGDTTHAFEILTGEYFDHARHGLSRRGVDALDPAMRDVGP